MDRQFDELAKSLAGDLSRREALRKISASLFGVVLAAQGLRASEPAAAKLTCTGPFSTCAQALALCNVVVFMDHKTRTNRYYYDCYGAVGDITQPYGYLFVNCSYVNVPFKQDQGCGIAGWLA
jgi:hypothetical protein